jgi:hypothetical protein
MHTVSEIIQIIHGYRLDLTTEKMLQVDMAKAFSAAGVSFQREKHLTGKDIPDFFVEGVNGGIVVECKIQGARKMETYKQLRRYASHPDVSAVILASNMAMRLPQEIEGKPVFMASLGLGWL